MPITLGKTQHTVLLCGLILAVFYFAGPVLLPFLLGLFIAWLFLKPTLWLQRRGVPRQVCAAVVTLFFCGAGALFVIYALPLILSVVQSAVTALPDVVPKITNLIEGATDMPVTQPLEEVIADVGDGDVSSLVEPATRATPILFSFIGSTLNALLLMFVTPFAVFYLLSDWTLLRRGMRRLVPEETYIELLRIWDVSKDRGLSYIRGRLLVVVCMGVFHIAGLLLIGLDEAVVIGGLAGVSVLIPVIGNLIVLLLALVVGLLQYDTLAPLLLVVGVFGVAQLLEMAIVEPFLLGDTMDLHPFVVLLVLMLGGHLMGIIGAVIALPVTAILVALLDAYDMPEEDMEDA